MSKLDNTKKILRLSDGDTVRYNNLFVPELYLVCSVLLVMNHTIRDSDSVDRLDTAANSVKSSLDR